MGVSPPSGSARSHPKGLVSVTEGRRSPMGGSPIHTSIPLPSNLGAATFPPTRPPHHSPSCLPTSCWDVMGLRRHRILMNIDGEKQRKPCPHSRPPPHREVNTACKLWAPVSSSAAPPSPSMNSSQSLLVRQLQTASF